MADFLLRLNITILSIFDWWKKIVNIVFLGNAWVLDIRQPSSYSLKSIILHTAPLLAC